MRTTLEFLNPFHRRGIYALPHIVAALLVLAVLALAGVFAVQTFDAHFYRTHYRAPLRSPGIHQLAPRAHVGTLPAAASIHFQYFMTAINDQDGLGSCQSWSFSKQISYAANWNRQANGTHLHHFLSPRFGYDLVSSGQDAGSYLEQYPPLARTVGVDRWIAFPYGDAARNVGYNPYAVDYPVPTGAFAAAHLVNVTEHQLFPDQGAGMAGVDLIRQALSTHHMVNIDTIVPPQFDNANQTQGNVAYYPNQPSRGGHAVVAVAYDDNHVDPYSGQVGAVLISNQWGNNYGIAAPSVTGSNAGGLAWLSYSFVAHNVWDAAVIHVSTAVMGAHVGHKPPFKGPVARRLVPPPAGVPHKAPSPKKVALSGYYVHGVYATDRPYDLSPLFNADGARWGISPVGLAATYASECGLETGVNGDCDRIGYGADVSGGGCQVTVGTAAGYGIGNGLSTPGNIFSVFAWEDNPVNCIGLEAHIMHDYSTYRGGAQYAPLNILWNCGPATTAYPFPYGQCASNYYGDFLGWWNFSLSHWATYQPPPPPKPQPVRRPFPGHRWCRFARAHHTHCPTHRWHKRDTAIARSWRYFMDHTAGGAIHRERWQPHGGYEREKFRHYFAYSWPRYGDTVKWVKRHHRKPTSPGKR